jgi:glycosyl transferase family 25
LVLEDDANLSRALPEFIERFSTASIPPEALVKVETIGSKVIVSRKPSFFVGATGLFRLRTPHMGVAGYIISRFGAERLAARHTQIRDSIDAIWNPWVARPLGMRLFQTVPALVVQDDFDTRGRNGLSSLIDSERVSRVRETRAARLFRGIRTFPRRGIVFGPRRAIPISC